MTDPGRLRVRSENLSWRRVGEEIVVLDLDETVCMTLNSSGAALWEKLAEGATSDELVTVLVERFAVGQSQAQVDVADFIARCEAEKLLQD